MRSTVLRSRVRMRSSDASRTSSGRDERSCAAVWVGAKCTPPPTPPPPLFPFFPPGRLRYGLRQKQKMADFTLLEIVRTSGALFSTVPVDNFESWCLDVTSDFGFGARK